MAFLHWAWLWLWLGALGPASAQPTAPAERSVTLADCVRAALVNNRALQIERLNPAIARATLSASYGYYDPVFLADARRGNLSDSGGFDPADFSRDATYRAESQTVNLALSGFLPSGLSYTIAGDYANSFGRRNLMNFDSYNINAGISVQQPLLRNFWIDQGRLTIKVNKKNLQITELGVVYLTMDIINQAQQAYYELVFAREHLAVQQRLRQVRVSFHKGVKRQLEVGTMTVPDEQLALAQLANAEALVATARQSVALAENILGTLMGESFTNDPRRPLAPTDPLLVFPQTLSLAQSWRHAFESRPDLRQLREDVAKADLEVKYRKNQLFPSLDLVAGYGLRGANTAQYLPPTNAVASASAAFNQLGSGDNPNDFIGVIFSLPLTLAAERGSYRASRQLKAQAALLVKQKEEWIQREISDALAAARATYDRIDATRRASAHFQNSLQAEERKLEGGKSTVFLVLELQGDVAGAQSAELRARADYNKALSQLRFAEATILEQNPVPVAAIGFQ